MPKSTCHWNAGAQGGIGPRRRGLARVAVATEFGRVFADWAGLKEANLHQKRDLRPTTDLRAVLKGVLRDHLRVPETALAAKVFPDSTIVKATSGLVAAA